MIPVSHCPNCGQELDAASAMFGNGNPSPGDISVCFYCATIFAFDDNLSLRNLTDAEMHVVAGDRRIRALINEIAEVKKDYEHGRRKPG